MNRTLGHTVMIIYRKYFLTKDIRWVHDPDPGAQTGSGSGKQTFAKTGSGSGISGKTSLKVLNSMRKYEKGLYDITEM